MNNDIQPEQLLRDVQDIDFIHIALIILGTYFVIVLIRRTFPYLAERGPSKLRLYLLGLIPVLRLGLVVGCVVWITPMIFEVTLRNFIVIFGAAGVAIGFAFKDYVSSIVAGVVAIFERPYRPGDWVSIGDDVGEVTAIGLRSVKIKTADNNVVVVPHGRIWTHNVSNANDGDRTLMCVAHFYVGPNQDESQVREMLHNVALTSAYLSYEHPVLVEVVSYELGTHYTLRAFPFDIRDQFHFISDLTERGKQGLQRLGLTQVTR